MGRLLEENRHRLARNHLLAAVRSRVLPGLWLHAEWLWQDPRPKLLTVLKQWRLV